MRVPKYISEYVDALAERDVRHQYKRLLVKWHAEQRRSEVEVQSRKGDW